MNLGPVTKLHKRNKTTSKKFGSDVISENCDFGAIRKPDSGRIVCKTYVFINSHLLSYNNSKRN